MKYLLITLLLASCGKPDVLHVPIEDNEVVFEYIKCDASRDAKFCLTVNAIVGVKAILPESRNCKEKHIKIIGQSEIKVIKPCNARLLIEVEERSSDENSK